MIKRLESLFGTLKGMKILRPVRTIIETMEGITLGTAHTAPGAPHIRDHIEIKRYMSAVIVALCSRWIALNCTIHSMLSPMAPAASSR